MIDYYEIKSQPITRVMVWAAYKEVRSTKVSTGIDGMTWQWLSKHSKAELYKLWNRLTSGSYFPQTVKEVSIPKKDGGTRKLGIPTLLDRIAQQVVRAHLEKIVEPHFHDSSFGYRPKRSCHDAVKQSCSNCFNHDFVIDLDIKSFFDTINHDMLIRAVSHFCKDRWVLLYIRRWLKAGKAQEDGERIDSVTGTPQGGVISPLLANIFMHICFDKWMDKHHPEKPFERYADDVVIHCISEKQSHYVLEGIRRRLAECKLRLSEEKTKITYCKDYRRIEGKAYPKSFHFLGHTFKPMVKKSSRTSGEFLGFDCEISMKARKRIIASWKQMNFQRETTLTLQNLAEILNAKSRGIINYYGAMNIWAVGRLFRHLDYRIAKWVKNKFKSLQSS